MEPVRFVIAGPPRGKGSPRATVGFNGRAMMNTDTKTRKEMETVRRLAQAAMVGREPFTGPVSLRVAAYMPIPASWPKRKQAAALAGEIIPEAKPDLSNIFKLLEDALQPPPPPKRKKGEPDMSYAARHRAWEAIRVVIVDDKQIAELRGWKIYSDQPRVVIEVRALTS